MLNSYETKDKPKEKILLVIQEQHFTLLPNGEIWVDQQSDCEFWQRYLNVFKKIIVCARIKKSESNATEGLVRSDRSDVSFIALPNFRGVAGLIKNIVKIVNIMMSAMKKSDCIIFRAPSPISMIAYPLARLSSKPYAAEIMNNPATHFSGDSMRHFYQPVIQKFIVWQTKSLCLHANGVSYVTESVLQKMYPSRARIKGESKQFFEASYSTIYLKDDDYCFEEWSNQEPPCIKIVHTGKMEDNRKGQDVFIEMIRILYDRGYNVQGILVGDGELRPQFEQLGKDLGVDSRLDFQGWKAGFKEVQQQLLRGHVAVFPSLGEGLPRSTIEAMASGLLCFGSKIDGMVELLDDSLLVDEFTGVAFADKIEPYLKDWDLTLKKRKELFKKSRKYMNSNLEEKRNSFYIKLRDVK